MESDPHFTLCAVEEFSVEESARSLLRESPAQDMDLAERDVFSFDGERCDRIVAYVLSRVGRLP